MKIIIGSVGRRKYLVDWFKQALHDEGLDARVVTTESDPLSAAATSGDCLVIAPRYEDPRYRDHIEELLNPDEPVMFISVNDYEISQLSRILSEDGLVTRAIHFIPHWQHQRVIEDKFELAQALVRAGIPTPSTFLGSNYGALVNQVQPTDSFVVKHRFGSGSSGLKFVNCADLPLAVRESSSDAPNRLGEHGVVNPLSLVIIQRRLVGQEYGVDGVYSAIDDGLLMGTLARRKDRMRSGETDKATTVDHKPFDRALQQIGRAFALRGFVDFDFIAEEGKAPTVIDINPRFGGGYPFMHVAGANAPRFYVRSVFRGLDDPDLLEYELGVSGAKYESVRRT